MLNVLVVEDEAVLAMDLEAMIGDAGHRVIAHAASVHELEALDAAVPLDLALVDIHLANRTCGLDASRLIRSRWPSSTIIFMTANPLKIPADYAGAQGVIPKPYSRNGLLSALRYIEQAILCPPPSLPRPPSLAAAPRLSETWN